MTITRALALTTAASMSAAFATAQHPSLVFYGKAPNAQYGSSVTLGDVNGDGVDDLIVGSAIDGRVTDKSGACEVRCGKTHRVLYTWLGPGKGDELGFGASPAGDVNGDGCEDIVVGVLGGLGPELSFIGHARVYSGKDGERLHTFEGEEHYDFYGLAVSTATDVNGDGHADIAVGAPGSDVGGKNAGHLDVFCGKTGSLLWRLTGEAENDQFGWFIRPIGDLDGDGVEDLAVGAPGHLVEGKKGYVRLLSGTTGDIIRVLHGEHDGDRLGWKVARVGDVDGDGKPDVLVGAPFHDGLAEDGGGAYVFSGATGQVLQCWAGSDPNGQMGWSVANAGDLNADGTTDFWIGSVREDHDGEDRGAVRLFSGKNGKQLALVRGRSAGDEFGFSITAAHENGSGQLFVGARSDDVATGAMVGAVNIYQVDGGNEVTIACHDTVVESPTEEELLPSESPVPASPQILPAWLIASGALALIMALFVTRRTAGSMAD